MELFPKNKLFFKLLIKLYFPPNGLYKFLIFFKVIKFSLLIIIIEEISPKKFSPIATDLTYTSLSGLLFIQYSFSNCFSFKLKFIINFF